MIAGHSSLSSRSSRVHVESLPSGSEAKFTSKDILVSTMPRAAVDIAAESNCKSTRKKYKNMFKKFVSYGYSVGHFFFTISMLFWSLDFSVRFIPQRVLLVLYF